MGSRMIVSAFAASIIGGQLSIYGAVLGGFVIGLAELLGTSFFASWLGAGVIPYRPLVPLIAIIITLLVAPKGLMGVNWNQLLKTIRKRVSKNSLQARSDVQ
jgi:branched-chain amino acid transport system permease protein